jgi:hypothetical protein
LKATDISTIIHGVSKNFPARLLGTRFEARNCINGPGLQDPYRDIFFRHPVLLVPWHFYTATSFLSGV